MNRINSDTDSTSEYFFRLEKRFELCEGVTQNTIQILTIAKSADTHFSKFALCENRYKRANKSKDRAAADFEKTIMLTLLYEIVDTIYMVINLLDLDELDLIASKDGRGLSGDSASDVVKMLSLLNNYAIRVLELEKQYDIQIDFLKPVDEKKGVTFDIHAHWQDFVYGDVEQSFYAYFDRAQQEVKDRINKVPKFWKEQTVKEYLLRKDYKALINIINRLLKCKFPQLEISWTKPSLSHLG